MSPTAHSPRPGTHRPHTPSPRQDVVVVGVDDSPAAAQAVRWAARLAESCGLGLHLAHGYGLPQALAAYDVYPLDDERDLAQSLVARVRASLDTTAEVTAETRLSSAVGLLHDAARTARYVVVGHHHASWGDRLLTGSVASGLSSRATCPVVTVPEGWDVSASHDGPVVVALDRTVDADDLLTTSVELARALGTGLSVMHVEVPGRLASDVAADATALGETMTAWAERAPDVAISSRLVRDGVDAALTEASAHATLLVVGRPHHRLNLASWTLSVGRRVLKRTTCPLAVVPVREPAPPTGLAVTTAGATA